MTLDPNHSASWRGLIDLFRPPSGFRLEGAVGTTYGMSFDALVASLLGMLDLDGEALSLDPLAGLLAATRLSDRVRIVVQAGTISGSTNGVPARLAVLLDRLIVEARVMEGIFHPKLWVLHFTPQDGSRAGTDQMRVIVGSRNLTATHALELGSVLEGTVWSEGDTLGQDVAKALASCLRLAPPRCGRVSSLPGLLRRTTFQLPDEGRGSCRLRWQGIGGTRHITHLPKRTGRSLVLSPYLSSQFVRLVLARSATVRIVSSPSAFRQLDDSTFEALWRRGAEQGSPTMFVVRDDVGNEDVGHIDGLHAKLVLMDAGQGRSPFTLLGSANATGAGWGMTGVGNAEALLELRPGLSMDRFLKDFLFMEKEEPKPWIREFTREDRLPLSEAEQLRDRLEAFAKHVAALRFRLDYEAKQKTLRLHLLDEDTCHLKSPEMPTARIECIPFGAMDSSSYWQTLEPLQRAPLLFREVALSAVSSFVAIRVRVGDDSVTRIAYADLSMTGEEIAARDAAARAELTATTSTEDILAALLFGILRGQRVGSTRDVNYHAPGRSQAAQALGSVTLEQMLQAVAATPDILRDIKLLLAGKSQPAFDRLQEDLQAALASGDWGAQ